MVLFFCFAKNHLEGASPPLLYNMKEKENEKTYVRCKAYCLGGQKCRAGATTVGYCLNHYTMCIRDKRKWAKLQTQLKAQEKQ